MTSEQQPSECFVYITPPRETRPVTAGRFTLTTDRAGNPVGRFVYGRSYLARKTRWHSIPSSSSSLTAPMRRRS